mgnify:CR=1 FL=1
MNLPNIRRALADYHGPPLTFMEICGTHTAAIRKASSSHAPFPPPSARTAYPPFYRPVFT